MERMKDVIWIKITESRLKRRLTDDELDGNPFMARFPDGHYEELCVPYLVFPHDLMSRPVDTTYDETLSLLNAS
jgi:hypothetical protein